MICVKFKFQPTCLNSTANTTYKSTHISVLWIDDGDGGGDDGDGGGDDGDHGGDGYKLKQWWQ